MRRHPHLTPRRNGIDRRGGRRTMCLTFATSFVASAFVVATAVGASATDDRCAGSSAIATCLHVDGDALYVRTFQPSALLEFNETVSGHWQIFDAGNMFNTDDQLLQSSSTDPRAYGPVFQRNRAYSPGDQICAIFWQGYYDDYLNDGRVCITISQ
jgi:hypothetical protein